METALLEAIVQGGPVAVLAYLIFWAYRRDRKSSEDRIRQDRVFMEDRMSVIIHEELTSRQENTKAVTELVVLLKGLNGRIHGS